MIAYDLKISWFSLDHIWLKAECLYGTTKSDGIISIEDVYKLHAMVYYCFKYKNEMKQLPSLNNRKSFKPIIYNKTGNKSNNQYNITKHEYE